MFEIMKKNSIIFSIICLLSASTVSAQTKLDMTGYGRTVVSDNKLSGNKVAGDTTTRQHDVSGYFLFDLGTNLTVGNDFKANAVLRVKSPFDRHSRLLKSNINESARRALLAQWRNPDEQIRQKQPARESHNYSPFV